MKGLTASHGRHALLLELIRHHLQQTPRTGTDRSPSIGIHEADQEEWDVILPGYSPEATHVWDGNEVSVAILGVADLEFLEIRLVVHVPPKDDRAKAKPIFSHSEELFLGHELAAKGAVDVNAGNLDRVIVCQLPLEQLKRELELFLFWHDEKVLRGGNNDDRCEISSALAL